MATILPNRYAMKGMYYAMPPANDQQNSKGGLGSALRRLGRIALSFLVPIEGVTRPADFMRVDPDHSPDPVQVMISRAEKPYKEELPFDETLDASVRLTPLVVAEVSPNGTSVDSVRTPLPQNRWGPRVVMPIF